MRDFELKACLTRILQKLDIVNAKVSAMPQVQVQVNNRFLATLNALRRIDRPATSGEVAAITGCARAYESMILNELVGRGIVAKEKQGRKRLFSVKEKVS